jgi:hypothetical protein
MAKEARRTDGCDGGEEAGGGAVVVKGEQTFIVCPDGIKRPLSLVAQKYGLPVSTIRSRLRAGDTGEALFRPVSIRPNDES